MMGPAEFRELISGRRRGVRAAAVRGLLRAAEVPYAAAVNWRNRRFDRGHTAVHRACVPVISVGNLTLGGTGKTPMVKWLARHLGERGRRVAIVSRGYGAGGGGQRVDENERDSSLPAPRPTLPALNDEALELAESLPHVPHVQDPDRVAAAERAIREFGCDVVLLDDGFQHRRLARDLDIVLLDALEPFGFDHVFPRGTLREPLAGLRRAGVVCLSRADAVSAAERDAIRSRVARLAPEAIWCELAHAASGLVNAAGEALPLDTLRGRRVAAFCGIGNPAGFRHTLAAAGCDVAAWTAFPDHHSYGPSDLAALERMVNGSGAELIVCTQKDLVKVRHGEIGGVPLWAVAIEIQFLSGQEALEAKIAAIAQGPLHHQ